MANMPLSASRIQASLPVLLINSSEDGISRKGESYIFTHLKKNPQSVFKLSHANHLNTPEENKEEVLKFIQNLLP
jgi:esterase/lipase